VNDLVERVARKIDPSPWRLKAHRDRGGENTFTSDAVIAVRCALSAEQARDAIRLVLDELREPSDDVVRVATDFEFTYAMDDYNSEISLLTRKQVEGLLAVILDAFARENGLETTL
jgi:hypothetical protein